ncbi:hypothetical protein [Halomonas alimentaria]|uniref:hypothetical protein n=1 Tax=Halomonas alimentaria TaxID=147248 RepID=UPI0024934450|nr:hypothetical protein [Halomonas alimentaria]
MNITTRETMSELWIRQNELRAHVQRLRAAGFNAAADEIAGMVSHVGGALLRIEEAFERHGAEINKAEGEP